MKRLAKFLGRYRLFMWIGLQYYIFTNWLEKKLHGKYLEIIDDRTKDIDYYHKQMERVIDQRNQAYDFILETSQSLGHLVIPIDLSTALNMYVFNKDMSKAYWVGSYPAGDRGSKSAMGVMAAIVEEGMEEISNQQYYERYPLTPDESFSAEDLLHQKARDWMDKHGFPSMSLDELLSEEDIDGMTVELKAEGYAILKKFEELGAGVQMPILTEEMKEVLARPFPEEPEATAGGKPVNILGFKEDPMDLSILDSTKIELDGTD